MLRNACKAARLLVCLQPGVSAEERPSLLREVVEEKFPTASFAVLELNIDKWADLKDRCARLVHLTRPRDLDVGLGPELA